MSIPAPLGSCAFPAASSSQGRTVAADDVRELTAFATRGLVPMFDEGKQLFCFRLLRTESGLIREGTSPRYTVMTLLGLKQLELAGLSSPFDLKSIYAALLRDTDWIQGAGDLGLLIWLTASFDPDRLSDFIVKFDCETALDRYRDIRDGLTMELAWFLSGLAHAGATSSKLERALTDVSMRTFHLLEENQGEYGFFGHMNAKKSLQGRLRGRIGSFADQVYPIYAMSKFGKALQIEEALGSASYCAKAICEAQGKWGQWWWLYDAKSGRVSSRYPVYSVHQHGMAPMALLAVEGATGRSFREHIHRGLQWIYGANELGTDMRDLPKSLIWRCVLPGDRHARFWEVALSTIRSRKTDRHAGALEVLHEQRPYEFGWLLFALAGNSWASFGE